MKFEKSKSSVFPLNGIFTLGSPSNIDSTTISYNYAKFGAFVSSVTIKTLRDLTMNLFDAVDIIFIVPYFLRFKLLTIGTVGKF